MTKLHTQLVLICTLSVLLTTGCGESHHKKIYERINEETGKTVPAKLQGVAITADSIAVITSSNKQFYTLTRKAEITSFPCSSCHTGSFQPDTVMKQPWKRKAHWDIRINHADKNIMNCKTCHDYKSMDNLINVSGKKISFDRPDQSCKSCHFEQHKDWEGGAHGKQYKNWAGPKIKMNCTKCHNPHSPGFEKKWPVVHPSIPRRTH